MMSRVYICALALVMAGVAPAAAAADQRGMAQHRRALQLQQQQDALNLDLRQGMAGRQHDLSPSDTRRLEQLQTRQRMERQLLEQQQLQRHHETRREGAHLPPEIRDRRMEHEQQTFASERALQSQQFELEQRRFMQSAPRAPLQPPIGNPQLDPR
jgi:hypothetical protein